MSFNRILIIVGIVLLASCKCDESQSCDGLSNEGQNLMPLNLAGSTFKSVGDSIINIYSRASRIQGASSEDCSSGSSECECSDCPNKDGRIHYALSPISSSTRLETEVQGGSTYRGVFYPNDTTIIEMFTRDEEFYVVTIDETASSSNPEFELDFLGLSYRFNVERTNGQYSLVSNAQNDDIELLASFSTPQETYTNVLVLDRNVSRFTEKSNYFNELYFSMSDGVVAFKSREGELFYLTK